MVKQREKVGQEAFLRAVAKGIKKSGHQEAGDQARSEILELASKIEEKSGGGGAERRTRPFSLHLQDLARGGGESVKTPDLEALDISRMSDSLYELQSDIKKLALQQSQIQSMMQPSSTKQTKPEPSRQPFFISKPQGQHQQDQAPSVNQNKPFYISPQPQPPQHQPFQMPPSSVPQQQLHNILPMASHHQSHPPSSSPQPAASYHNMSQQHQPVSQSPQPFHVSTNPGQRRTWGQPFDPVPQQQQFHHQQHQGPPHHQPHYEGHHYQQGGQHSAYNPTPPHPQRAPYDQQNVTMYDPQPPPSHRRPASYDQRRPPYAVDPAYDPSHFQDQYHGGGGAPPMGPYRDPGGSYRDPHWGQQQPQPPPSSHYNPSYNASFNQTFPPQNQPGGNYVHGGGGGYPAYQPPPPSYPSRRFPESQQPEQSPARSGSSSPFRTLSRSSSLRKGDQGRPASASRSRHSSYHEEQSEEELTVRQSPVQREVSGSVRPGSRELSSSRNTRENSASRESRESSANRGDSPNSRPKVTLVPRPLQSPMKPPTAEKPSLSTTFLQQKRLEAAQRSASPPADSHSLSESSQSEMTNSCLETLSTMKTEVLKESEEAKGFVISFDAPGIELN